MNTVADDALAAEFAVHADEALELANATFGAAAGTWLRVCVWPDCLNAEQQLRLVDEIGCELIGVPHPEPAAYDQHDTCRCVDETP